MKEEKTIITYEALKKEFKREIVFKLPLFVILFIAAIVTAFKAASAFGEAFTAAPFSVELITYAIFILILDIILFVLSLIPVYELIQINKCRFLIFEDRLLSMGEEYVRRKRSVGELLRTTPTLNTGSYQKVFNFRDHGQYVITPRDRTAYDYSSPEDLFLVISLDVSFNKTILVYNKKVYEFKDSGVTK